MNFNRICLNNLKGNPGAWRLKIHERHTGEYWDNLEN